MKVKHESENAGLKLNFQKTKIMAFGPITLWQIDGETMESNRMGKTRDLLKKIRDTKGTFHAKMGTIKDRNGMDLTEAEGTRKRWQEYREELTKKILMT